MSIKQTQRDSLQQKAFNASKFSQNTPKNKEHSFMQHFDSLRDSKAKSQKTSQVTSSSEYHQVFQAYSKKRSQIDSILDVFDNGHIFDVFEVTHDFGSSQAYLRLPKMTKNSIEKINTFFRSDDDHQEEGSIPEILNAQPFAQKLAQIRVPFSKPLETELKAIQRTQTQKISLFQAQREPLQRQIQGKIELIMTEIANQKKRKDVSKFYLEAMTIKLNELLDEITEQDDQYLGLALNTKAHEVYKNISQYRGQSIEGYLKLPLLDYFFCELRELQENKHQRIKGMKKQTEKKEVCSQIRLKSSNVSRKGGKYSEPNTRRNKQIREEDWIGNF